jgi:hypothetical protein
MRSHLLDELGNNARATEFRTKVNKYGFLHVPKKALPLLPFELEKPLIEGETLVIAATTKKPT